MKKIAVIIFVLALFTPLFLGDFTKLHEVASLEEADKYIGENFGGREELIRANAMVNVFAFDSSPNKDVVVGRDGWLFLSEDFDKGAVEDWSGVADNMLEFQETLAERDIQFLLVLVPDKHTVYRDFLPWRLREWDTGNYDRFFVALSGADVNFVDLREYLFNVRDEERAQGADLLYSKEDTHWNRLGAFMTFREAMKALGVEVEDYVDITTYERAGDLSRLVGLNGAEETWDVVLPSELVSGKAGRLLFFYDSFGEGWTGYLEKVFDKVNSIPVAEFSIEKTLSRPLENIDVVIVEVVERDLEEILMGKGED